MKTAKAICATAFLALSLSVPAYAEDINNNPGEIHLPGRPCQITDSESPVGKPGEPCGATTDPGDGSFSDLRDILWVVASIF